MSKQQTAVEWFWNKLPEIIPSKVDSVTGMALFEAYIDAKQMEKEQIINAYLQGCSDWDNEREAEQYYNETYDRATDTDQGY